MTEEPTSAAGGRLELIRDLGERGLSRAAEALSRMLGWPVGLALMDVCGLHTDAMSPWTEDVERRSAALLQVSVSGEGRGRILILLPIPALSCILRELLGRMDGPQVLTEIDRSAAQEFGNVLASSFLNELGDRLGRRFLPSPPALYLCDLAFRIGDVWAWARTLDTGTWVMRASLAASERSLEGQVLIVLDDCSLAPMTDGAAGARGVCT